MNFDRKSQISREILNESIRHRSNFRWLSKIFAKKIKRKFGIPTPVYRSGFACFFRQVNGPRIKFNKFELPFAAPIQI